MSDQVWFTNNDNIIDVANEDGDGFFNELDGFYLNAATVTGTVRASSDPASAIITGITQPVTFNYVAGSNGRYKGMFDKLLALVKNTTYYCHISLVSGTIDQNIIKRIRAKDRIV